MKKIVLAIGEVTDQQCEEACQVIRQDKHTPVIQHVRAQDCFLEGGELFEKYKDTAMKEALTAEDGEAYFQELSLLMRRRLEQFENLATIVMDEDTWINWYSGADMWQEALGEVHGLVPCWIIRPNGQVDFAG